MADDQSQPVDDSQISTSFPNSSSPPTPPEEPLPSSSPTVEPISTTSAQPASEPTALPTEPEGSPIFSRLQLPQSSVSNSGWTTIVRADFPPFRLKQAKIK